MNIKLCTFDSNVTVNTAWLRLLSLFIDVEATRRFSHPELRTYKVDNTNKRILPCNDKFQFLLFTCVHTKHIIQQILYKVDLRKTYLYDLSYIQVTISFLDLHTTAPINGSVIIASSSFTACLTVAFSVLVSVCL